MFIVKNSKSNVCLTVGQKFPEKWVHTASDSITMIWVDEFKQFSLAENIPNK